MTEVTRPRLDDEWGAVVVVGEEADVAAFLGDIEDAVFGVGEAQAGDGEAARGVA
ncbi:MAG: hypothetical protein IPP59_09455 [Betaproteobacteria bacterium]|nr:hypothetical protein [Betaproteobacteria bacterium]MBK9784385.1 hypothetical protein [Candidatus Dechloromonas phosphorivorans]